MDESDEDSFRRFALVSAASLRRCAFLFCGDWHLAEDLVQAAMIKIYRSWTRVRQRDTLANYGRTVLLRTWLDEKRRPWRRAERSEADLPEVSADGADPADETGRLWARELVHQGLLRLPRRQRAVLVLRYFDDLSVAETAEIMRCSEGTVKSQTARGLAALRVAVAGLSADELGRFVS